LRGVFCPKCGAQNADGAAFCNSCGASLAAATPPMGTPTSSPPAEGPKGKSAIVAAFLNLFFGIGYLYLGYQKILGVPAIVFVLVSVLIYFVLGLFTFGLASVILAILFAVDGWQKASGGKGYISAS